MTLSRMRFLSCLSCLAALLLVPARAHAELIYGITEGGAPSLVSFDSATPGTVTTIGSITGLLPGQNLRSIDFRPSNGLLYGFSSVSGGTAAQLYTVNLTTGALTTVGGGLTLTGNTGLRISVDFDPVADILRVVTLSNQNYRVDATNGTLIARDTDIPRVLTGIAYSNNTASASSTTLYAYDYNNDLVGRIGSVGGTPSSPNAGVFTSIGSSTVTADSPGIGFDISGNTGIAYLNIDTNRQAGPDSEFYTANLATGALTFVGTSGAYLLDIAVKPNAISPPVNTSAPEPGSLVILLPVMGAVGMATRRRR